MYYEGKISLEVAPGNEAPLPLTMHDEFNYPLHSVYALRIDGNENLW